MAKIEEIGEGEWITGYGWSKTNSMKGDDRCASIWMQWL